MNNQIILSALQAQIDLKKADLATYKENVYYPAKKSFQAETLTWLRENVSSLIPNIDLSSDRIEFMKAAEPFSNWSSATIYLQNNWKADQADSNKLSATLNWYGSSARTEDENTLLDVQVFGALASKLGIIEYQFTNIWLPILLDARKPIDDLQSEINGIDRSIKQTESDLRSQEINAYKKLGFACSLNKFLDIDRMKETTSLVEHTKEIQISTGRGKWDYQYVVAFKVLSANKYKATLEITSQNNKISQVTITNKSFETFIANVYNWQTKDSEDHNKSVTAKYNKYCETHK